MIQTTTTSALNDKKTEEGCTMQQQNEIKKELCRCLTVWPDLGTMFGISRTKAYQLVKEPGFPALRLGPKRIVIPEDKLLHWLEHQAEIGLK